MKFLSLASLLFFFFFLACSEGGESIFVSVNSRDIFVGIKYYFFLF